LTPEPDGGGPENVSSLQEEATLALIPAFSPEEKENGRQPQTHTTISVVRAFQGSWKEMN
jgi:hypothetical protein